MTQVIWDPGVVGLSRHHMPMLCTFFEPSLTVVAAHSNPV